MWFNCLKNAAVYIIGDTHGDWASTQQIIEEIMRNTSFNSRDESHNPYVVFLGDYVNNGLKNIENLMGILKFQAAFPGRVILLNGNHEFNETYHTALN